MSAAGPLRLGLRLARRDLRRAPVRAFLVVFLVFVPAAAMATGIVLLRSSEWTAEEERSAGVGRAELWASPVLDADDREPAVDAARVAELTSLLPEGSSVVVQHRVLDGIPGTRHLVEVTDLDVGAPTSEGIFLAIHGVPPRGPDEAAVTPAVATELDLGIGDALALERLERTVTVTAVVDPRHGNGEIGRGDGDVYLGAPLPTPGPTSPLASFRDGAHVATEVHVDLPGGMLPADEANGLTVVDLDGDDPELHAPTAGMGTAEPQYPAELPELRAAAEAGWSLRPVTTTSLAGDAIVGFTYLAGGFGLALLGTIVTAAFAVGARRQLRNVGLLAATGASPGVLRWYLVAQGVVAGFVGAALGVVAGVVGVALVPDDGLRWIAGHAVEGIDAPPRDLVPVVLIGTLVAAAAAALPAITAARVPTLAALAGRRPQRAVPAFVPFLGVVAVAAGCLLLFASVGLGRTADSRILPSLSALLGSLAVLAGCVAVAPAVLGRLERWVGRAPTSWRLAGRSLARSRMRSSAVIAAVVAVTVVLVGGSTLQASSRTTDPRYEALVDGGGALPDHLVLVNGIAGAGSAEVGEVLPAAEVVHLPSLDAQLQAVIGGEGDDERPDGTVHHLGAPLLATPAVQAAYEVPDDLREVLAEGGWILAVEVDEPLTLQLDGIGAAATGTTGAPGEVEVPLAGSFDSPAVSGWTPVVLVGETTAEELGLKEDLFRSARLFVLPEAITDAQRDAIEELRPIGGSMTDDRGLDYYVTTAPSGGLELSEAEIRALILAVVFLGVLAVVGTGLLLAGRDSADEAGVLRAVGAPPRVLRRVGALRGFLLVAVAVAVATPAGLLAAWSIFEASRPDAVEWPHRFQVDGTVLLFALVLAPVVGLLTWLTGGARDLVVQDRPHELATWD